jgi:hypothetical protein
MIPIIIEKDAVVRGAPRGFRTGKILTGNQVQTKPKGEFTSYEALIASGLCDVEFVRWCTLD